MSEQILTLQAQPSDENTRLDKVLSNQHSTHSRQYLQKLIKDGLVQVNGKNQKPNYAVQSGDQIEIRIPAPKALELKAAPMKLDVIFENGDLLVLNKPPGLVTHPGVGSTHLEDSLVNALLHHCKDGLSGINGVLRPGIVHRLDKDTSGLLIVAKNDAAHRHIVEQMKNRAITKIYKTLLYGKLTPGTGTIEAPIGRHPRNRKLMAIVEEPRGRSAITHYEVEKYFQVDPKNDLWVSLVKVQLVTGRTHQIRVHFASIGHPVVGDAAYGRAKMNTLFAGEYDLHRQFLHAWKLSFTLPGTEKKVQFEAPLPQDLATILTKL